ncbi:hypothetical protein NMY22_g6551 [Coprinellus aureogranulatus]|nr:hypothetical protein NMY22_g6551 [Coprinellus aureogranulatus]
MQIDDSPPSSSFSPCHGFARPCPTLYLTVCLEVSRRGGANPISLVLFGSCLVLLLFSSTIMDVSRMRLFLQTLECLIERTARQVASLITWDLPLALTNLTDEEVLRIKSAICEFSDSPATFEWFEERGYILFKRDAEDAEEEDPFPETFSPRLPSERSGRAEYPYAHYDLRSEQEEGRFTSFGKIWFAHDSQNRHVAICLVPENSDELRVYEVIRAQTLETLRDVCLLPALDILPLSQYRFVVMPRWGGPIMMPEPQTLREVTDILHSMLKALDFLHSHRIVHRDISLKNVLMNHYCNIGYYAPRRELRSSGRLCYATIDFDIAVAFSPDKPRSECVLESRLSLQGTTPQPNDTEPDDPNSTYDPFAFDVGCMVLTLDYVKGYTAEIPFLAPLLDKMTTKDVPRRFTAGEALLFFETHLKETPIEALMKSYSSDIPTGSYEEYDRWSAIPSALAQQWAEYREPLHPSRQT